MRSALFVNLLTEDNLPYYFRDIDGLFGRDERVGRVGAPLDRRGRSPLDRDPRLPDGHPCHRSGRARAGPHGAGEQAARSRPDDTAWTGVVYVTLQELATRIAHRNTGKVLDDPVGYEVMARVAADENLHHLFYRDLASAAIEVDPSAMVIAIERRGAHVRDAGHRHPRLRSARRGASPSAGIYDLTVHYEQILVPVVMRQWKVAEMTGLNAEAETQPRSVDPLSRPHGEGVGSRRGTTRAGRRLLLIQARCTGRGGGAGGWRS